VRKKILGIVVCMLMMIAAIPIMGLEIGNTRQAKENIVSVPEKLNPSKLNPSGCGRAWIILTGNTSAMIGAKIFIREAISFTMGPFMIMIPEKKGSESDVKLIDDPNNPFNGSYGVSFDVCGLYRVDYINPLGKVHFALYKPYFVLKENELIEEYIILPVI